MTTAARVAVGIAALSAAAVSVYVAAVIEWLACLTEGTEACQRQSLAHAQLRIACIGTAAVLAFVIALMTRRSRLTWLSLIVGIALFLAWGLSADAAVHGWDDLKLNPFD